MGSAKGALGGSTWGQGALGGSTWGHPQGALGDTHEGSYLAQFEAVFFGTFFASSANRC